MTIHTFTATADDQEKDITDSLEAAMALGDMVELKGGKWRITRTIKLAPGAGIAGVHAPVLRLAGHIPNAALILSDGCFLLDFDIDADKASKKFHYSYAADIMGNHNEIDRVNILRPLSEAVRVYGDHNKLTRMVISDGNRSGIFLRGDYDTTIDDVLFKNMAHFGIHADQGSNRGYINNARTIKSGLELVALLQDTRGFRVTKCHAQGTGDNGISIGGYGHVVMGNVTIRNDHNGICLFGSENVCVGNHVEGNNQRIRREPWPTFAGISITPAFGSLGRENVVTGNWSGDKQADPTQWAGVLTKRNSHVAWAAGATVNGSNPFRSHAGRVYKAAVSTATVCGSTPPTHTSGAKSDGTVTWNYVAGEGGSLDAYGNMVSGNVAVGNTHHAFLNGAGRPQAAGGQL